MSRMALLLGTIVLTMLAVITVRNEDRLLFSRWAALQAEGDQLNVRWGKLLLEQGAFAAHERVGQIARRSLDMRLPGAKQTVLVYSETPDPARSVAPRSRVR
ncbi:MAG: cell division protein FtsL [Acidiferrobacteraceae bacterium]